MCISYNLNVHDDYNGRRMITRVTLFVCNNYTIQ